HLIVQSLALQAGSYAGAQQRRIERLGQIVLGTQLNAADNAVDLVDSGNHDDRDVPQALVRLHCRQHLVAVHLRHHDVEQDEIERFGVEQVQSVPAVGSGGDVQIALAGKPTAQRESVVLDVVDHEQRGVAGAHDPRPAGVSARILPSSRCSSPGLVPKSSQPAASAFSLSLAIAFAVRAITGMRLVAGSALIRRVASWPSILGRVRSIKMRSGCSDAAMATPWVPSVATITMKPARVSRFFSM